MSVSFKTFITLSLCIALSGCANDQQRTETQGTTIGALGGAVVGAGLGALTGLATGGGNTQSIITGMIIGGAAGAAAGGVAGYQWGKQVAIKKSQYQSSEAYLQANIAQAQAVTLAAQKANTKLASQIAKYNSQIAQVSNDVAAKTALKNQVNQTRQDLALKIKASGNEIADRQAAVKEAGSTNEQQVEQLVKEITGLQTQRKQLQQNDAQLATISSNLSGNAN
jgi:hypothetical protein